VKVNDYLLLEKTERLKHVELNSPCLLEAGASTGLRAKLARDSLLKLLGLQNNVKNWRKGKVQLCHLCPHNSKNGYCHNPLHCYLGTPQENNQDLPPGTFAKGGRKGGGTQGARHRDNKTGLFDPNKQEQILQGCSRGGKTGGLTATSVVEVSLFDGFVSAPCRVARHNQSVGADPNDRVRLSAEQAQLLSLCEEFEFTTVSQKNSYKRKGLRLPKTVLDELKA
jgi:hypothetical protein